MSITVIICTYNRSQMLGKALRSIAESVMPTAIDWEVLVVDNNSSDTTKQVVDDLARSAPGRFRYLMETRPGKSFALNTGIRGARGQILAFTDDDVVVASNWLEKLTAPLLSGKWGGVAGRIVPIWDRPLPGWMLPDGRLLRGPFVAFDLGSDSVPLKEAPVGANMAFKRQVFERHGGFRTDLGPRPGLGIRGEDSEFGDRLLAGGENLIYEPSAVVYHPVSEERLQKKYSLSWFYGHGYEAVVMSGASSDTRWRVTGVPLYLIRRLARWTGQWLLTPNDGRRFECRLNAWGVAGAIRASYDLYHSTKKSGLDAVLHNGEVL